MVVFQSKQSLACRRHRMALRAVRGSSTSLSALASAESVSAFLRGTFRQARRSAHQADDSAFCRMQSRGSPLEAAGETP